MGLIAWLLAHVLPSWGSLATERDQLPVPIWMEAVRTLTATQSSHSSSPPHVGRSTPDYSGRESGSGECLEALSTSVKLSIRLPIRSTPSLRIFELLALNHKPPSH